MNSRSKINRMDEWRPLSNIWEIYTGSIKQAISQGLSNDPEVAEGYAWPPDLNFGSLEQDDVRSYVNDRMGEIIENLHANKGIDPNFIAAYIFRTLISGMMWERQRVG